MEYPVIEGELVTLKRVDESTTPLLHEHLQVRKFYREIGRRHIPTVKELNDDLFDDQMLFVWQVYLGEEERHVGYAGFVAYSGPPYIFYFSLELPVEYEIAQDCFQELVPLFFRDSEEPLLYTYVEKPVSEQLDELLVEGGFDALESVPAIDNNAIAVYAMERHTYEAYYGDEDDDETEELEF